MDRDALAGMMQNVSERICDYRHAKGMEKPIVASLASDAQVQAASEYPYERGILAYPYSTQMPVPSSKPNRYGPEVRD